MQATERSLEVGDSFGGERMVMEELEARSLGARGDGQSTVKAKARLEQGVHKLRVFYANGGQRESTLPAHELKERQAIKVTCAADHISHPIAHEPHRVRGEDLVGLPDG
jgi:hypothetical protein